MIPTAEQIEKLPVWAQRFIQNLAASRDEWRALAQAGSVADSNVTYDQTVQAPFGLSRNSRITFKLGAHSQDFVEVYHGHPNAYGNQQALDWLTVRGGGPVIIHPAASNTVGIQLEGR